MESHLIGFNEGMVDVELTLILNVIVKEAWIYLTLLKHLLLGPQAWLYLVFSGHQPANHFVVLLRLIIYFDNLVRIILVNWSY